MKNVTNDTHGEWIVNKQYREVIIKIWCDRCFENYDDALLSQYSMIIRDENLQDMKEILLLKKGKSILESIDWVNGVLGLRDNKDRVTLKELRWEMVNI